MRVALVVEATPSTTLARLDVETMHAQVDELGRHLDTIGHRVSVHHLRDDPLEDARGAMDELESAWSGSPPDVVHAYEWPSGMVSLAALRDLESSEATRSVLTLHPSEPTHGVNPSTRRAWRRLASAVARSVDRVVAPSDRDRADVAALGVSRRDIDVIPHGVDTDLFSQDRTHADFNRAPRVLTAGGFVESSGFDTVITAMRMLPGAELTIVGYALTSEDAGRSEAGNEIQRLQSLAQRLGVASRIRLVVSPDRTLLPDLLHRSDVVVCVPRQAAFDTIAVEAMSCGRPVIASDVGAFTDEVLQETTGVLLPPGDATALGTALRDLLTDPVRLDGFGLAGANRAHARYSWDRVATEMSRTYEQLVAAS